MKPIGANTTMTMNTDESTIMEPGDLLISETTGRTYLINMAHRITTGPNANRRYRLHCTVIPPDTPTPQDVIHYFHWEGRKR